MNSNSFFPPVLEVKYSSPYHAELVCSAVEKGMVKPDFVSTEGNFRGTLYKKGFFLCLNNDESMKFGQIELVVMKENKDVYFLVTPHSSSYMPEYGLYKIGEAARDMVCINADQCLGCYPLPAYSLFAMKIVSLKHAMDDIATLIKEALPTCSTPETLQPILDALQNLGVETVEDMKLVQMDDLAGVLKPIQARNLLAHVNSEIIAICKKTSKKHLDQIARNMVQQYPKSLKDMIEDEMVESGHDSITKQLQCRVDNYKRNAILKKRNSTPANVTSIDPENKKKRLDLYGCSESDITSGKDMQVLKEEWPYLFSFVSMKKHFKLLTVVNINEAFDDAMTTKLAQVLDYFQSLPIEKSAIGAKDRAEIQASGGPSGAVLMLHSYFKEDQTKMFHIVDKTCIANEVETEHLPPTTCIIVCDGQPAGHYTATKPTTSESLAELMTEIIGEVW
ncbi:hypothetical protein E1301_Tti023215 [Triplophysa tibetana]|uniref:Uncharacterized protein n=1 Tax=Triplophysa tibetana TaxID=1572043 RepID=A0A5A9PJ12_9TELE|nr:hypothetical protein E1301_Tti023215 [Triplophysa tibetana]